MVPLRLLDHAILKATLMENRLLWRRGGGACGGHINKLICIYMFHKMLLKNAPDYLSIVVSGSITYWVATRNSNYKEPEIPQVHIHFPGDGRDTDPKSNV